MALMAAIAFEGLSRVGPDDEEDELSEELEDSVDEEDELEELPDEDDAPVSNIWAKIPLPSPS